MASYRRRNGGFKRGRVILLVLLIALVWLHYSYQTSKAHAMQELAKLQEQKEVAESMLQELKNSYQVEETNRCITMTIDVMALKEKLSYLTAKKNGYCAILDNPPDSILNPDNHFVIEYHAQQGNYAIEYVGE